MRMWAESICYTMWGWETLASHCSWDIRHNLLEAHTIWTNPCCLTAIFLPYRNSGFILLGFYLQNVSRWSRVECKTSLESWLCSRRENLMHFGGNSSSLRSSAMATDLKGCLWDERENHRAQTWIYYTPYAQRYRRIIVPPQPPEKKMQQCSPDWAMWDSSYLIKAAVLFLECCKQKKGKDNQTVTVLTSSEE